MGKKGVCGEAQTVIRKINYGMERKNKLTAPGQLHQLKDILGFFLTVQNKLEKQKATISQCHV